MGALLLLLISLLVIAFVIWVAWYIAKQFAEVAQMKGHYDKKYLWICFLLGGIGYLLVAILPDRANVQKVANDELPDL